MTDAGSDTGGDHGSDIPAEPPALHAKSRPLFLGPVDFVKGVVALSGLPDSDRVEVAFAGRSNVGKSSLINALTGRNGLARTSNTPGRTQELNYFRMGDDCGLPMFLVDLPGYGYAKVERRRVNKWNQLIRDYLRGRSALRRVMMLIDSRHGLKDNDLEIADMLDEAAVSYQIILTKLDKLKVAERSKIVDTVQAAVSRRVACHPVVLASSAEKGFGLDEIRSAIAELVSYG